MQIGGRNNQRKDDPRYSAIKPLYVIMSLACHLNSPIHKMKIVKITAATLFRDSCLRLSSVVEQTVVDQASIKFVEIVKKHGDTTCYWHGLQTLNEPKPIAPNKEPPSRKKATRVTTRKPKVVPKAPRQSRKRTAASACKPTSASTGINSLLQKQVQDSLRAAAAATAAAKKATDALNRACRRTPQTRKRKRHKQRRAHSRFREESPSSTDSPNYSSTSPSPRLTRDRRSSRWVRRPREDYPYPDCYRRRRSMMQSPIMSFISHPIIPFHPGQMNPMMGGYSFM